MDKKAVRKEVTEKKKLMKAQQIASLSAQLKERLCSLEAYKNASVIYAYMSYNQEVRTKPVIEQAWADKKRVALPLTVNREYMEFIYINSFDELKAGYMGIMEPEAALLDEPGRIADEKEALMLVPGLAFDKECSRTGYGGGFYDKYLAARPCAVFKKIALCFDFQIYDRLETQEHDVKMDMVISNSEVYISNSEFGMRNL